MYFIILDKKNIRLCFNLTILDQVLRKKQLPYVPNPVGIWPLSKSSFITEPSDAMSVTHSSISIDPLWSPAGFQGSPLLASARPPSSNVVLDYTNTVASWPGITIMFWMRLDEETLPTSPTVILVIIPTYVYGVYKGEYIVHILFMLLTCSVDIPT